MIKINLKKTLIKKKVTFLKKYGSYLKKKSSKNFFLTDEIDSLTHTLLLLVLPLIIKKLICHYKRSHKKIAKNIKINSNNL